MHSDFYVYLHKRKSDDRVFYIGKGRLKRAYTKSGRSKRWIRTVNKYGYYVEIIHSNLQESQAFSLEKEIIKEYKERGFDLCNFTDGGEGTSGVVVSDETKMKISIARKEYISKNKDKVLESIKKASRVKQQKEVSESTREKLRISQLGKKQSEETIKKRMSHFQNGRVHPDETVYLFVNTDDTVFIGKRYQLCDNFQVNITQLGGLFANIKGRTRRSVKGWSVAKNYITLQIFLSLIKINNLEKYLNESIRN